MVCIVNGLADMTLTDLAYLLEEVTYSNIRFLKYSTSNNIVKEKKSITYHNSNIEKTS